MPSGFFGVGIGPTPMTQLPRSTALDDPVPALATGTNLIVNGDMETGSPSPTNWVVQNGATLSSESDERTGGSGSKCLQAVRGTGNATAYRIVGGTSVGMWCKWSAWLKNSTSPTGVAVGFGNNTTYMGTVPPSPGVASTDWTQLAGSVRITNANPAFSASVYTSGAGRFDDVEVYAFDSASLFSLIDSGAADANVSANITRAASGYYQVGLIARCDSASNPQNFIMALMTNASGTHQVAIVKCVAGTYSTVQAGTNISYSANAKLRLICSGNNVSVYYAGAQVGSTITVSDAGIVSNTLHGKFSTSADNTFSRFVI